LAILRGKTIVEIQGKMLKKKNLRKFCNKKFEKKMLLLMNKNLKVILIIPTLNTYTILTSILFENIEVQYVKSS
jgi:hypothetical protein